MAVKIVHTTRSQEVRFGARAAAEHYAAYYGGLGAWQVLTIPRREAVADGRAAGSKGYRLQRAGFVVVESESVE